MGEEMTHEGMKEEGIVVVTGREERRTTSAARNVTLKMMLRESRTGKNGTRREQPKKRNAERRNANYRRSVTNVAEKKIKDVEKKMMKGVNVKKKRENLTGRGGQKTKKKRKEDEDKKREEDA